MIQFSDLCDREHKKLLKVINGAIKSCISAHGSITAKWIGSAGKRVVGALKAYDQSKEPQMPSMRHPKVAAYSKNAPFRGGVGYIMWEIPDGAKKKFVKTPMCDFLKLVLK